MKKMKKEYFEPAMRVAELKHRHHLLAGSNGQGQQGKPGLTDLDENMDTYTGGDETINEDDVI